MNRKTITKNDFPHKIVTERTIIRRALAEDIEELNEWPPYPHPFGRMTLRTVRPDPDGIRWWRKINEPDRCHYSVILQETDEIIGVYAFIRIDWQKKIVGNMGCFIRADVCSEGYGSETLCPLFSAVLKSGIRIIRLDVISNNPRAIKCYQKCGMKIVDKFYEYQRRFFIMEISAES